MREATDLVDRLRTLGARAEEAERLGYGPAELEDMLATGYAVALSGEARMVRIEHERDELERAIARLRRALASLQAQFVANGGAVPRS